MNVLYCQRCGRQRDGRHETGLYCQPCLLQSIEQIFVHAADHPTGGTTSERRRRLQDDSGVGNADTPGSQTLSGDGGSVSSPATMHSCVTSRSHYSTAPRSMNQRYATVNMRPVQQMQMLSSFLNSYFPTAKARADLANRRSYLAALPDIDITTTPILRLAVDTLCYAHIGLKDNDIRLVRESQASYAKVLNLLIRATNRPDGSVPYMEPKTVVTSIMLLCLYDDAIPLPFQGQNGWAAHYWGALQLLKAHGASVLNMNEPFDRLIFWNLRMPTFFLGIARRKAVILGEEQWLALAEANADSKGPLTEFYRTSMKIPALLERTDNAINSQGKLARDLQALCAELLQTRNGILSWFQDRTKTPSGAALEIPETFSVTETEHFKMETEEHCFMTSSETFTSFFKFRTPGAVVRDHTLMQMTCLVLDCTLLRLLHFLPGPTTHHLNQLSYPPQTLQHTAFNLASDICRVIHHYSTTDGLAHVDFTEFLIEMVQNFFEENGLGAARELGWCQAVRVATKLRRERIMREIQPRTLCRMHDAGPGFAAAMRFRTRRVLPEGGGGGL